MRPPCDIPNDGKKKSAPQTEMNDIMTHDDEKVIQQKRNGKEIVRVVHILLLRDSNWCNGKYVSTKATAT